MNFIFFEVHWGMTEVGCVQSEWTPGFIHFARDPLRSYLNKFQKKIKFINIFTLFFSRTLERTSQYSLH